MGKKYAIAAIVTMMIGSGYILYTYDIFHQQTQTDSVTSTPVIDLAVDAIPTTTKSSVSNIPTIKPAITSEKESVDQNSFGFQPNQSSTSGRFYYSYMSGKNKFTVTSIRPDNFDLLPYIPTPHSESFQLFIVDQGTKELGDNTKIHGSFYVEKDIGDDGTNYCYFEFCFLNSKREFKTESRTWQFLGGSSYGDAGYVSDYPFVFSSKEAGFTIYVMSETDLSKSSADVFSQVFNSINFTVN